MKQKKSTTNQKLIKNAVIKKTYTKLDILLCNPLSIIKTFKYIVEI